MDEIPRGTPVIVYRRRSTNNQVNSLEDQNGVIQRIVKQFDLQVVDEYEDAGISGGTIDEREGLKSTLAEAGRRGAQVVLAYDTSRISRGGLGDFWRIVGHFADQGIQLYNCQRGRFVDEDDLGNALQSSMEAVQAKESNKKLAEDVARTLIAHITIRRNAPGGPAPFGYDRLYLDETGKPFQQVRRNADGTKDILNPESPEVVTTLPRTTPYVKIKTHRVAPVPSGCRKRVEAVESIFRLAKSMGYAAIANHLNNPGLPGPLGGPWSAGTVRDVLFNPVYAGNIAFNRTSKSRYVTIVDGQPVRRKSRPGKLEFKDNPKEQWIVIPDVHEALVPKAERDAVGATLALRSSRTVKTGRGRGRFYPLSGILVCGHCGGPMQGICSDKRYRRYLCSKRRQYGRDQCVPCSLLATKVEAFVLDRVRGYLASDCAKEHLRRGLEEIFDSQRRSLTDMDAVQCELEQLRQRKDELFAQLRKVGPWRCSRNRLTA